MGLVSIAGPVSNIAAAALLSLPLRAGAIDWQFPFRSISVGVPPSVQVAAGDLVSYAIFFNVFLAVFNLVPLVPLDGFRAAVAVLPRQAALVFERLEQFGPWPLLLLILIDIATPSPIVASIVVPVANALGRVVVGHPVI
jgi:Zn-dependent protease